MTLEHDDILVTKHDSDDDVSWDAFVEDHEHATLYHSTGWQRVITDVFRKETYYLRAEDSNRRILGVLPLVRLGGWLDGKRLVSIPYCNYGGELAAAPQVREALERSALSLASKLGVESIELRRRLPMAMSAVWQERLDKVVMKLPLAAGSDELWSQLGSKLRAQIKRPLREGALVMHGGVKLIPAFYGVFCENMRDLGTPVYPRQFFESVAQHMSDRVHVILVNLGDATVAACFLLSYRDTLEIPWASSLRRYNSLGINMLLYWEALKFAADSGYALFDFGRCTKGGGTHRFKAQWGATCQQLHWWSWSQRPTDECPVGDTEDKHRMMRALWRTLPLAIANRLGPRVTSNLPW